MRTLGCTIRFESLVAVCGLPGSFVGSIYKGSEVVSCYGSRDVEVSGERRTLRRDVA